MAQVTHRLVIFRSFNYWFSILYFFSLGQSSLALFPSSTQDVSKILSYCNSKSLPIVIQGGNTSLVAGSVPVNSEIILSMQRMNHIHSFDETSGILLCDSGCILETLEDYVSNKGYIIPYDLGAKGSCHIGGNVATNAGGIRYLKYGSLHGSVLGLEVVLANGSILNFMNSMRKDNTGYDLKQLFIGSEGTLGVITKVSILCSIKPSYTIVAFLSVKKFEDIKHVFKKFKRKMTSFLSAFEMIDEETMDAIKTNLKLSIPFPSPFYILVELSMGEDDEVESQLMNLLDDLMNQGLVVDGTYSKESSTMNKLWAIRERCAEALLLDGYCYKYDVSLNFQNYYELVEVMRKRLKDFKIIRVSGYGHIADSNLHLTITTNEYDKNLHNTIEPFIYEWIRDKKGSISAEHGIGLKKRNFMHFAKSENIINVMKQIKFIFDNKFILNPGKVLPD